MALLPIPGPPDKGHIAIKQAKTISIELHLSPPSDGSWNCTKLEVIGGVGKFAEPLE